MSDKKSKAKKEEVVEEEVEQEQPEVKKKKKKPVEEVAHEEPAPVEEPKPKKKKKHTEEVQEKPAPEAKPEEKEEQEAAPPKKSKKKAAEVPVVEVQENSNDSVEEKPAAAKPGKLMHHEKTGTQLRIEATNSATVEGMEGLARTSHRSPRVDSPRSNETSSEGDSTPREGAQQVESARKEKPPQADAVPRLYFHVTEAKDIKPGNYYVTVTFNDQTEPAWTSETTKKSTTWDKKGRILPIPKGATSFTVTLFQKGLIGDILDKAKGEAIWEIKNIDDGYPHQPWASLLKKGQTKASVRVQLMYLPEGVDIEPDAFTHPIHSLIRTDKPELLVRAVDDLFSDLKLLDAENRTPLHLAVQLKRAKIVKLLLKKLQGEGNNLVTNKKETALHFAAKYSTGEIATQLLKAGFDVNATADAKRTPLHMAAVENNVDVIKALGAAEGVALNAQDKDGNPPLADALLHDHIEAVIALIELKADVYVENDKGLKVWEIAGRKDMVNMEPRKAFMNALEVHDAREFPLRQKYPRKIVVHGEHCARDYEDSTQFAISVEEPTDVSIILTTNDVGATTGFVAASAFALIKSDQGVHNEPAISRDTIDFSGNKAVTRKLEPNFFYVVTPYAKTDEGVRDYELVILHGKKKKVTVNKLKPWAHHEFIESEWKKENKTAGGAQPAPTWTDNPKFELTMPPSDDVRFLVHLSQADNDPELRHVDGDDHKVIPFDLSVGFYVCDRQGVKVLAQVDKWINARDVHKEFVMSFSERNHICIIPATHQPGEEGIFCLRVYCDQPFTIDQKK